MEPNIKIAIITGVLFIIATVFFIIGQSIYSPLIKTSDYLLNLHLSRIRILTGILIEFIGIAAIILIPAVLFPVLKKYNEGMALAYAGFRFLEAGFLLIVTVGHLSLLALSKKLLENNEVNATSLEILGTGIKAVNEWNFMMSVSFLFPISAIIVYTLLYRSKLIPRFISAWGFLSAAHLLVGSILIMFNLFSTTSTMVLEIVFSSPIALQEMVFAVWLIVKGFNSIPKNTSTRKVGSYEYAHLQENTA